MAKTQKKSAAARKAADDGLPEGDGTKVVKVRHGLAFYLDAEGNQHTVFRNQKVEMPASEAERLEALGAVVGPDDELPMVGRITPIPNTASDEELIAWVSVATKSEIVNAIAENPALGDRILAARDVVQARLEAQNELLGGVSSTVRQGKALAKKRAAAEKRGAPTSGADGKNARRLLDVDPDEDEDDDEEDDDDDDDDLDEDDPRSVVRGSVGDVAKFLQANPDKAVEVLDAEKAEALDKQRDVRPGIVHAVQAAANANNQ
jgi:hypothetical protein